MMSEKLKKILSLFFKYFENKDKEMLQLYYKLLSEANDSFIEERLMFLMCNRDKKFKFPSLAEILAPLKNAEKENCWKLLNAHLKNPYDEVPDHIYILKKFLEIPVSKSEYAMSKIKDQFFSHKYDEFRYFLEGKIKIPSLKSDLTKLGINLNEEFKKLESRNE